MKNFGGHRVNFSGIKNTKTMPTILRLLFILIGMLMIYYATGLKRYGDSKVGVLTLDYFKIMGLIAIGLTLFSIGIIRL